MVPPSPSASPLDDARERVVRLLTDRYADDTLTIEEFEARLDRMHALSSPAALEAMARELEHVGPPPMRAMPRAPLAARRPGASPGTSPEGRIVAGQGHPWPAAHPTAPVGRAGAAVAWQAGQLVRAPAPPPADGRLLAVMSNIRRQGVWEVPRTLQVRAIMSEVVLDLRAALLPADGCEIQLSAVMANVRVLLPHGVDARVEVMAFMGAANDRRDRPFGGAGPVVRLTGTAVMAEVTVRDG